MTYDTFCAPPANTATCALEAGVLGDPNTVLLSYDSKPLPSELKTVEAPPETQLNVDVVPLIEQLPADVQSVKEAGVVAVVVMLEGTTFQPAAVLPMPPIHLPTLVTGPLRVAKLEGSAG